MDFIKRNAKRVATDAAGYGLIVLAVLTGWLPGPGGIPLALAGLGLLSINNEWARALRDYLLHHGGKIAKQVFPANAAIQICYDILVILLLILAGVLIFRHAAAWQISLAIFLLFLSLFIALMNRERLRKFRKKTS
jgi:hypothetical protein